MDQLLPQMYATYGKYINQFRSFPLILDGCKLVERRLLVSTFEVAPKKFEKAAGIIGHCIKEYHPHGENCYDTLVKLVNNGLLDGTQGNWGLKLGIKEEPPAAMRYPETRMIPFVLDLAFEYVSYIERENLEYKPELPFLPIKLPLCLMGKESTQGIGFGYRTYIPVYKPQDLIKRLEWLLGYRKEEPIIKPLSDCIDQSTNEEHQKLLTTGKGKLTLKGRYEVDEKSVIVRSWPETKQWGSIESKFQKEVEVEKSIGIVDESNGKNGCQIRFIIKRQRGYHPEDITKKLDKELVGSITYECNMVNVDGKVVLVSPDTMLMTTYNVYKQVISKVLSSNIEEINSTINELKLIEKIKPILSVELKANSDNIDKVTENISKQLSVDLSVIKELFEKYTVGRLFRIKTETYKLLIKLKELQDNLSNIESYIWSTKYKNLK